VFAVHLQFIFNVVHVHNMGSAWVVHAQSMSRTCTCAVHVECSGWVVTFAMPRLCMGSKICSACAVHVHCMYTACAVQCNFAPAIAD
jgi:hypothetical protein